MQDPLTGDKAQHGALPLTANGKAKALPAESGTPQRGMFLRLKLWRIPLVMALLFTGAIVGLYFQPPALRAFFGVTGLEPGAGSARPIAVAPLPPVQDRDARQPTVVALGRLMPEGDTVTLALPFGAGDARIARLLIEEGSRVEAGQVVAELDSLPQHRSLRDSARATVAAREASLAQTRASAIASLSEATATRDRAAATRQLTAAELERILDLAQRGVATGAQRERAEAAATEAARELDRAEATVSRFAGAAEGLQADIVLAERNLDVARLDLVRAEQDLSKGLVVAPSDGTILKLHVRPGEKAGSAGVATMGNTDRMLAELEVYQTDIRHVALGQSVELRADALGDEALRGSVERIGLEVGRQMLMAADPAANSDARVVNVEVALDPESSDRATRFTGLEVVAQIDIERTEAEAGR